jgi:hypothetical protein
MGWSLGPFAATQIDFGLRGKGELERLKIGVLVGTVAKRLVRRTPTTTPPVITRFQFHRIGCFLCTYRFRHKPLLIVIIS